MIKITIQVYTYLAFTNPSYIGVSRELLNRSDRLVQQIHIEWLQIPPPASDRYQYAFEGPSEEISLFQFEFFSEISV